MDHVAGRGTAILPNLITVGNAVCGFAALTLIAGVQIHDGQIENPENLQRAAWFILLGMLFDVFDGRVARMTGGTSNLGAQLDSLADLVTFGLAPAGLMVTLHRLVVEWPPWTRIVWIFGLAYFLGAMLRLARFNVEHDESEEAHQCFKGLPTPAAAGTVASWVLVYGWLGSWSSWELKALAEVPPEWVESARQWIPLSLPFICFVLGYTMVSGRLIYPHVASRLLGRGQSFDTFVVLVFAGILVAFMLEPSLAVVFLVYMVWPIAKALARAVRGAPKSEPAPTVPAPGD